MPSSKGYKRDYTAERKAESPSRKKNRVKRNKAREECIASGKCKKGDGKHVDHKKPLSKGGSNKKSNRRVQSASKNSSRNGHKPGETQRKKKRK